MNQREYRFHKGARTSMTVVGILLMITVIGLPFGIWVLWRASAAKLTLTPTGIVASQMFTKKVTFADVARFGVLRVPLRSGGGVGGALGRHKIGGSHAIHLCFQDQRGRNTRFMVSMFENEPEITAQVGQFLNRRPEEMIHGGMGPSWPKLAAAA